LYFNIPDVQKSDQTKLSALIYTALRISAHSQPYQITAAIVLLLLSVLLHQKKTVQRFIRRNGKHYLHWIHSHFYVSVFKK